MALQEITDRALSLKDLPVGNVIEGYYDGPEAAATRHGDPQERQGRIRHVGTGEAGGAIYQSVPAGQ